MSEAPIRWGIIGCGSVCEVKSGPALYKCRESTLVAVFSRNEAKAKSFAERHCVPKYYSRNAWKDLIADDQVDAVYVATPPGGSRREIASCAAAAGKPTLMEKPLGRDANEAKEICHIFQKANVSLYVAYCRRYMPKFQTVKDVIDKGLLGEISSVSVTMHRERHKMNKSGWRYDRAVSGGGIIMDVGCHMLDLVDHFVGPLEQCHGVAMRSVVPDITDQGFDDANFVIEDNVRGFWVHTLTKGGDNVPGKQTRLVGGSCEFNFASYAPRRELIEIAGTEGSVTVSCFDTKPAVLTLRGSEETFTLEAQELDHVHRGLIQSIVDELQGKAEPGSCVCTAEAGVRTSVALDHLLNNRKRWDDAYVNE